MTTSERVLGVVGIVAYLAAGLLFLVSGLVVPEPWQFGMWVVWLAGWWLVFRVYQERRTLTWLVAVLAVVFWVFVVQMGDWLLGWTA